MQQQPFTSSVSKLLDVRVGLYRREVVFCLCRFKFTQNKKKTWYDATWGKLKMNIARLSQDEYIHKAMDTKVGLIQAEVKCYFTWRVTEWCSLYRTGPQWLSVTMFGLLAARHIKYLSILINSHICLYSKWHNVFVRSTCVALLRAQGISRAIFMCLSLGCSYIYITNDLFN